MVCLIIVIHENSMDLMNDKNACIYNLNIMFEKIMYGMYIHYLSVHHKLIAQD